MPLSIKRDQNLEKVETVVGEGAVFKGQLEIKTGIKIDGRVEGDIACAGDVFVGEKGVITAGVNGRNVSVAGEVNGNVVATQVLHIQPSGRIKGDIRAGHLVVEDGAQLEGKCTMTAPGEEKPAEPSVKNS
jgi:cytoskeletal protein CcmA (bactofilin family)